MKGKTQNSLIPPSETVKQAFVNFWLPLTGITALVLGVTVIPLEVLTPILVVCFLMVFGIALWKR